MTGLLWRSFYRRMVIGESEPFLVTRAPSDQIRKQMKASLEERSRWQAAHAQKEKSSKEKKEEVELVVGGSRTKRERKIGRGEVVGSSCTKFLRKKRKKRKSSQC